VLAVFGFQNKFICDTLSVELLLLHCLRISMPVV